MDSWLIVGTSINQSAIVIPLDIRDLMFGQDLACAFKDMSISTWVIKVKY